MSSSSHSPWCPTTFIQFDRGHATSMDTARIVTDAGPAYIKAMGNRQGPHALACELVGTQLANWFGLPVLTFALINVDADVDEIPFASGGYAASGPAFVTHESRKHDWSGTDDELKLLVNPGDIAKLVVFDTWTRNEDRFPPDPSVRKPNLDNVFLEEIIERKTLSFRLVAMDHSHCFTSGAELTKRIAFIGSVKDDRIYGLFPAFVPFVTQAGVEVALNRLAEFTRADAEQIIATIPDECDSQSCSGKVPL